MQYIRMTDFFKYEIKPFVLGAFLSRVMETTDKHGNKYFYAYTSFHSSKAVFKDDFDIKGYGEALAAKLDKLSGHYNWSVHSASDGGAQLRYYVLNDRSMPKTMFYKSLFAKTVSAEWALDDGINEAKKDFIRGFMELRGSIDTSRPLIAQDYFYDGRHELKKALILTDTMSVPIRYANFNARNLQPQFVSGENKRNAQFRMNLPYYAREIGFVNDYKAMIFRNAHGYRVDRVDGKGITYFDADLPRGDDNDMTFVRYLNFFTNNIYAKRLTPQAVKTLRAQLGFSDGDGNDDRATRNATLRSLFYDVSEDKCAICGATETFTNRATGRQHFEVHHVISFCNDATTDNIANLVKLCPTCHALLKKDRASKSDQTRAILKILHEHEEIFDYASSYLQIDDINDLAEKIQSMLG